MKLPVFSTFGNALGFALGNFLTCLRLVWLPVTLLLVVQQGAQWLLMRDFADRMPAMVTMPREDPSAIFQVIFAVWKQVAPFELALLVLQALVIAAVAVSIHRVILFGDRREGSLLNFSFGKTEFLYILMAAAMSIFLIAVLVSVMLPAILVVANGDMQGFLESFRRFPENIADLVRSGRIGILGVAYLLALILVVYFAIRLAVWPPSVVATGSLSPSEPWNLMRGNVLRFIGLVVLCGFVLWILLAAITITVFSLGGLEALKSLQSLDHQNPVEMQRHMQEKLLPFLPVVYVVLLPVYTFVISFSIALISYAYKALKGYSAADPIPA